MVPQHHVVLYHAQPARLGIPAGTGRVLDPLQLLALRDVGAGAVETRLFVVPQDEADRALGPDVGGAEDAREFHDERRAGAVVVHRLVHAVAVHVGAKDVHLVGARRPHLRAVDLGPLAVNGFLAIEFADALVGLRHQVAVYAGAGTVAEDRAPARPRAAPPYASSGGRGEVSLVRRGAAAAGAAAGCRPARGRIGRRRGRIGVEDALGARAAEGMQLRLDPVDGVPVALRALAPVAELRQALERRLVVVERQPRDEGRDGILRFGSRLLRLERGRDGRQPEPDGREGE